MSATEPYQRPPTISATIIAVQIAITVHVLRSFRACASPRKTCAWRKSSMECVCMAQSPSRRPLIALGPPLFMVKASHPIVVEKVHEQVAFEVGWPQRPCPLLAHTGRANRADECPL